MCIVYECCLTTVCGSSSQQRRVWPKTASPRLHSPDVTRPLAAEIQAISALADLSDNLLKKFYFCNFY